jgi:copper(I)-binding protein
VEVDVTNAWVRATVPGQPVAGAYLDLRASSRLKLVGASSPVAGRGEIHEMKDEDGMMKMRAVEAVDLPAGKTVSLAPGGLHVMLFGLAEPLAEGRKVALTLRFRRPSGATFTRTVEVPVKAP